MKRIPILKAFVYFRHDRSGAIAIIVALVLLPLFMALGASIDLSVAYYLKARLGYAVDAAALAVGSTIDDDMDVLDARAQDFFAANYPGETIGWVHDIDVRLVGDEISVSAEATFDTYFLKLFQTPQITVTADAKVIRAIKGLEVALVLDNTGSMRSNNNIGALRTASTKFVEILFGDETTHPFLSMAIVPYAASVNPGPEAFGGDTTPTAPSWWPKPSDKNYVPFEHNLDEDGQGWKGCVIERSTGVDAADLLGDDNTGGWEPFAWEPEVSNDYNIKKMNKTIRYDPGTYQNSGTGPNLGCPSPIIPLTNVRDDLLDEIKKLDAWHRGGTLSDIGMAWGRRVLSPEAPFTEGKDWGTEDWEKAIVLMTDGENQFFKLTSTDSPNEKNNDVNSDYTGCLRMDSDNPLIETNNKSTATRRINARLAQLCEDMKEQDIIIYTVTFTSGIDQDTKDVYKYCATDTTKWFDSPTQTDLEKSFSAIAVELSKLRVAR